MKNIFDGVSLKSAIRVAGMALILGLSTNWGQATVITFSGLPPTAFGSPYTESGFTITPSSASWDTWYGQANAPLSVGGIYVYQNTGGMFDILNTGSIQVQETAGGTFTFNDISISTLINANINYEITGLLGANTVFTYSGTSGTTAWNNIDVFSHTSAPIDTLDFSFSAQNDELVIVNDIDLLPPGTPVPDQGSTAGLLTLSLLPLCALGIRRLRVNPSV